ncbi:cyclic nucleotide-binding protein [Candidatus Magnetoovum chiemensis]|nr:cyclic nucleotide-binding protein [Candidatus Magnetoovum chiemensis]
MSQEEICELLERSVIAMELDWPSVKILAKYLEAYTIQKDCSVFKEEDTEPYLCLVAKGRVNILKKDSSQKQKILTTVGPGRTFGEMSLIDGEPRSASAIAAQDSTLFVLTQAKFNLLKDETPRLAVEVIIHIAKFMSQKLRKTSGLLVEYMGK